MERCKKGFHIFDTDKHLDCPYCNGVFEFDGENKMVNKTTKILDRKKADNLDARENRQGKTQVMRSKSGVRVVTAWLVITEGPGKGASLPIFYGMNSIGRSKTVGEGSGQSDQEVCLDFGLKSDSNIARESQAKLTYDRKGNVFYLQHGGGSNLTYLNGEPVLELKTLSAYDKVAMGNIMLIFVPFCGDQFQWPDDEL